MLATLIALVLALPAPDRHPELPHLAELARFPPAHEVERYQLDLGAQIARYRREQGLLGRGSPDWWTYEYGIRHARSNEQALTALLKAQDFASRDWHNEGYTLSCPEGVFSNQDAARLYLKRVRDAIGVANYTAGQCWVPPASKE